MENKRTHERVAFSAQVTVFCKGQRIVSGADTRNISLKGIYVETDKRLGIGTHCGLELQLTGASSQLTLNIDGRVVREDDAGFGIVFNTVDLDSYFHLKNILLYNAVDSDALSDRLSMGDDDMFPDGEPSWEDD
ncbi:MAG: PilZ domain-containing protein [Pseudomonadota bacterium]